MRKIVLGVLMAAALAAPSGPAGAAGATEADLMKADQAFSDAASKGLDAFLAFVAEDAGTLRPNQPVVEGRKAFGERWADLLNDKTMSIRWTPRTAVISKGGDLGYTVGSYEIQRKGESGWSVAGTGKYVTIWRHEPDGSWKVVFDSGVQDTPPPAAAPH